MITRLSLKYSDGFTSDLISFDAKLSKETLLVNASWFDPNSNNTKLEFEYRNHIKEFMCEVSKYVDLKEIYQFPTTDLHSVSVKYEIDDKQYTHFFYGIGPALLKHHTELSGITNVLELILKDIVEFIIKNKHSV
jgi:hypothetical protein